MTPSGPPERFDCTICAVIGSRSLLIGPQCLPTDDRLRATGRPGSAHRGSPAMRRSSRPDTSDARHRRASVTRPCDQCGSGSRSHIGYSQNSGVDSISALASTKGMLKRCTCGIRSSNLPARDQSSLSRRRAAFADLHQHRPIGQRPVLARAFADRIDHQLAGHSAGDHHRAAGEEFRPVDRAAPQHRAVPACRAFVRVECFAHKRMNSVGADQDVAARRRAVRAVAAEEIGR